MREPGPTFASNDIGFFDWELHSSVDIENGTYRYMAGATPLILAVAVGEDHPASSPYAPWESLPQKIKDHHARVARGEAIWAAWNAAFDREAWNQLTDYPPMEIHHVIDVMAQAVAAGLPGDLATASRFAGAKTTKRASGKDLIKLFCLPASTATQQTHPNEWAEFLHYAADDVAATRDIFRRTLQLPLEDWREYWASERINLNGIAFDQKLAARAAKMATLDKARSAQDLTQLTSGAVTAVTKIKPMIAWLQSTLSPEDQSYLVREEEQVDEDTLEVTRPERHTLDRNRIKLLTALLDAKPDLTDGERKARRLLDIRQYGGSTTPAKFSRMLSAHVDGLLLGQFVFNGAPQTGRFSSRITQLHNLLRDALPYELDAIDALAGGCGPDEFATLGDETPISRKLSMLIRPTLIPEDPANAFVWGDWSQIEARVLPWLAGANHRLNIFREVDANPDIPDLYTRTAAAMSGVPVQEVTKQMRQRGKVAELALGFCGGKAALQAMAANYNMHLSDEEAQDIVTRWREVNAWAIDYSRHLWETMRRALGAPGHFADAGRVGFIFLKEYLGGTLLMRLPSGRFLTYRAIRWEYIDVLDEHDAIVDRKLELMFARGYGRIKLWPGIFVENATQATAACILRGTLERLVSQPGIPMVRAHTHDEILLEVHADRAEDAAMRLIDEMERGFEWTDDLPLKAEASMGWAYSKCAEAQGL